MVRNIQFFLLSFSPAVAGLYFRDVGYFTSSSSNAQLAPPGSFASSADSSPVPPDGAANLDSSFPEGSTSGQIFFSFLFLLNGSCFLPLILRILSAKSVYILRPIYQYIYEYISLLIYEYIYQCISHYLLATIAAPCIPKKFKCRNTSGINARVCSIMQ